MKKLLTQISPCSSCPYRRDCPSGVWDQLEYEKLLAYDTNEAFAIFLCHLDQDRGTACRGWLTVHAESVAARLGVLQGQITNEQRYAPVTVPLHGSGAEAAKAGMKDVKRPRNAALRMIDRLKRLRGEPQ